MIRGGIRDLMLPLAEAPNLMRPPVVKGTSLR
jgi:hypothetical protein